MMLVVNNGTWLSVFLFMLDRKHRLHVCDIHGKTSGQTGILMTHMLVHTGEKTYAFVVCSKQFTQAHYLKLHMPVMFVINKILHRSPMQTEKSQPEGQRI